MGVIPKPKLEQLTWFEQHVSPYWEPNATAIGLTAPQIEAMTDLVTTARNAFDEAETARTASKNATLAMDQAFTEMYDLGTALVATIKAKALADGDPNIYVKADVPPPATPQAAGIPPVPTSVSAFLNNEGNVDLEWVGTLANQTFYSVTRRLAGENIFTEVGSVPAKKFTDETLPAGTTWAMYQIFAVRSAGNSEGSEPVTVLLGNQDQMAA